MKFGSSLTVLTVKKDGTRTMITVLRLPCWWARESSLLWGVSYMRCSFNEGILYTEKNCYSYSIWKFPCTILIIIKPVKHEKLKFALYYRESYSKLFLDFFFHLLVIIQFFEIQNILPCKKRDKNWVTQGEERGAVRRLVGGAWGGEALRVCGGKAVLRRVEGVGVRSLVVFIFRTRLILRWKLFMEIGWYLVISVPTLSAATPLLLTRLFCTNGN